MGFFWGWPVGACGGNIMLPCYQMVHIMSMSEAKTTIADTIKGGTTHYKEIAKKLGKTEGSIRKTISVMKKAGQVIPIGGGHYQLPKIFVDDPVPKKSGPEPTLRPSDYVVSNEKGLRLLIKTRDIVSRLMNDYDNGKGEFPVQEVGALEKLERIYKDQVKVKTEESQEIKKDEFRQFIILPDNHRQNLTQDQYADHVMYELLQMGKTNEMPNSNVIIEKSDQTSFPFYPL